MVPTREHGIEQIGVPMRHILNMADSGREMLWHCKCNYMDGISDLITDFGTGMVAANWWKSHSRAMIPNADNGRVSGRCNCHCKHNRDVNSESKGKMG